MDTPEDIASLRWEELRALVAEQQQQITQLQGQLAKATATIESLQVEVERLTREKKRQAAPFSKGTRVSKPKRPGRKPGEGTFSFRQAPRPEEITEPPVKVPVTLECCPRCGGKLAEERVDLAYLTELPPMPRPRVTQYGATAHRLGPRAMAAAHALHYQVGIPVRKTPLVLNLLTGMELTQGAITQDALRRARGRVGQAYQELRA